MMMMISIVQKVLMTSSVMSRGESGLDVEKSRRWIKQMQKAAKNRKMR